MFIIERTTIPQSLLEVHPSEEKACFSFILVIADLQIMA